MGSAASTVKRKTEAKALAEGEPDILVSITVIEGRNLPSLDANGLSDPYVILECDGQKKRTSIIFESLTPEWNQSFEFLLHSSLQIQTMTLQCWDNDIVGSDDIMGETIVTLPPMGQSRDMWCDFEHPEDPTQRGEIHILIERRWRAHEGDADAILRVRILEARNLLAMDRGNTSDPYVVVTFNGRKQKTKIQMKTLSPKWYQTFDYFCFSDQNNLPVLFQCWDWDRFDDDDLMGTFSIPIPEMGTMIDGWFPLTQIVKKGKPAQDYGEILIHVIRDEKQLVLADDAELVVEIKMGRRMGQGASVGLFIAVEFCGEIQQTPTRANTDAPRWASLLRFPAALSLPPSTPIKISLFDLAAKKNDPPVFFGSAEFLFEDVFPIGKNIQRWQMLVHPDETQRAKEKAERGGGLAVEGAGEVLVDILLRQNAPVTHTGPKRYIRSGVHSARRPAAENWTEKKILRQKSIGSSGFEFEFEKTSMMKEKRDEKQEEDKRLRARAAEMAKRQRKEDSWLDAEQNYRAEQNLMRDRNARGQCGVCGVVFSIVRPPQQCPKHTALFHVDAFATVLPKSCLQIHLDRDKQAEREAIMRELDKEAEMARRKIWDESWDAAERLRAAQKAVEMSKMQKTVLDAAKVLEEYDEDDFEMTDWEKMMKKMESWRFDENINLKNSHQNETALSDAQRAAEKRTVHVYVCSDIEDMPKEREIIATDVAPRVNAALAKYRVSVIFVDLRYGSPRGITTDDLYLSVCFSEIDRCAPLFLGLLGNRYGSVPTFTPPVLLVHPWLESLPKNLSMLHLEIIRGHFHRKPNSKALFYIRDGWWLRDPVYLSDMTREEVEIEGKKKERDTTSLIKQLETNVTKAKEYMERKIAEERGILKIFLKRTYNIDKNRTLDRDYSKKLKPEKKKEKKKSIPSDSPAKSEKEKTESPTTLPPITKFQKAKNWLLKKRRKSETKIETEISPEVADEEIDAIPTAQEMGESLVQEFEEEPTDSKYLAVEEPDENETSIPIMAEIQIGDEVSESVWVTSDNPIWPESANVHVFNEISSYVYQYGSLVMNFLSKRRGSDKLYQIGRSTFRLNKIRPNVREVWEIDVDDNDAACVLVEFEYLPPPPPADGTPKKKTTQTKTGLMPLAHLYQYRDLETPGGALSAANVTKNLPDVLMRQAHSTDDPKTAEIFEALKQTLRAECNVIDFGVAYDGVDRYNRVKFKGLDFLTSRIVDDLCSLIDHLGHLTVGKGLPFDTYSLEALRQSSMISLSGTVIVGRTKILENINRYLTSVDRYVDSRGGGDEIEKTKIMCLVGPNGCGRSSLVSVVLHHLRSLHESDNLRLPEGTKETSDKYLTDVSLLTKKEGYGGSWQDPVVVSFMLGVGGGEYGDFISNILRQLQMKIEFALSVENLSQPGYKDKHTQIQEGLAALGDKYSYASVKQYALLLLQNFHEIHPGVKMLIMIDGAENIIDSDFSWLPLSLSPSLRIILTSKPNSNILSALAKRDPPVEVCEIGTFEMYSRKEFVHHTLAVISAQKRVLSLEARDEIVSKPQSPDPTYLSLALRLTLSLPLDSSHSTSLPAVRSIPGTVSEIVNFILTRIEKETSVCPKMIQHVLSLLEVCTHGLTERDIGSLIAPLRRISAEQKATNFRREDYERNGDRERLRPWTGKDLLLKCSRKSENGEETHMTQAAIDAEWPPPYVTAHADEAVGGVGGSSDGERWRRISDGILSRLLSALSPLLVRYGENLFETFIIANSNIREAISRRYSLHVPATRMALHTQIFKYFLKELDPSYNRTWPILNARAARVLPFHVLRAGDWSLLGQILTDIIFLHRSLAMATAAELLDLYALALNYSLPSDNAAVSVYTPSGHPRILWPYWEDVWQFHKFLSEYLFLLDARPSLLLQLAANEGKFVDENLIGVEKPEEYFGKWGGGHGSAVGRKAWERILIGWNSSGFLRWRNRDEEIELERGSFLTLNGHVGWVRCLAFVGFGGDILISGGDDSTLRFWNTRSGEQLYTSQAHTGAITALSVSRDQKYLATVSVDGNLKLWEIKHCQEMLSISLRESVHCVCWSADGKFVAVGNGSATPLMVISVTGTELPVYMKHHTLGVRALCWSPWEDQRFVSASSDGTAAAWELKFRKKSEGLYVPVGRVTTVFKGHTREVRCLAWLPHTETLATGSEDYTIKLWDVGTGKCTSTFEGHISSILSLCYNTHGTHLISASVDRCVRVWDLELQLPVLTLIGHEGPVFSSAMSYNNYSLATSSSDAHIKIWSLKCILRDSPSYAHPPGPTHIVDSRQTESLKAHRLKIRLDHLASPFEKDFVAPKHAIPISPTQSAAEIPTLPPPIDPTPGEEAQTEPQIFKKKKSAIAPRKLSHKDTMRDGGNGPVTIASKGSALPNGSGEFSAKMTMQGTYNGKQKSNVLQQRKIQERESRMTNFVRPGAIVGISKPLTEEEMAKRQRAVGCKVFAGVRLYGTLTSISFNLNSTKFLTTASDGTYVCRDSRYGLALTPKRIAHYGGTSVAKWGPNDESIFSAGADSLVKVWDTATGRELQVLNGHRGGVNCISVTGDGKRVVSGGAEGGVTLWNTEFARHATKWDRQGSAVTAIQWNPDDHVILSGSLDGQLRLLDDRAATQGDILFGHTGRVSAVSIHINGLYAGSGSYDETALLWDLRQRRSLYTVGGKGYHRTHKDRITGVALSPSGRHFITGCADSLLRIFDTNGFSQNPKLVGEWICMSSCSCVDFSTVDSPDPKIMAAGDSGGRSYILEPYCAIPSFWDDL